MPWDNETAKNENQAAVDRIKSEAGTVNNDVKESHKEDHDSESIWFEDGSQRVTLLDGKSYRIYPVNLKKARRLLQLLKTVNVDMAISNFIPSGDDELDAKREEEFMEMVMMAFDKYNVDRDYVEENVDVVTATTIATVLLGVNGIKK